MPRTQTVHFQTDNDVPEGICRAPGATDLDVDKVTCEDCLKAIAELGRRAIGRAYELGLFNGDGRGDE